MTAGAKARHCRSFCEKTGCKRGRKLPWSETEDLLSPVRMHGSAYAGERIRACFSECRKFAVHAGHLTGVLFLRHKAAVFLENRRYFCVLPHVRSVTSHAPSCQTERADTDPVSSP